MDRRDFLVRSTLGAGALALHGVAVAAPDAAPRPLPRPLGTWESVRAEFDRIAPDRIHMSSFFLASHPRTVRESIEKHRTGLDLDPLDYVEVNVATLERAVRAAASGYLGGKPDDLAMTDSTTQGLGTVYGGIELRAGQEILSTTHDHIVTELAVDYRAARAGGQVRRISLYDDPARASAAEIADRLEKAIKPQTRVIALTWVHSGTGVKLPLRALGDVVAKINAKRAEVDRALLIVDGVHGFGNQDVDVSALGCDFFIAGCHKWIFGPRGTGLVWGRPAAWPLVKPAVPSMDPMWRSGPPERMPPAAHLTPGGFHSFEHRWALPAAFELHQRIGGKAKIAARIRDLNTRCKQGLAKLPRVRLKTPMSAELSAGILCFEVDGLSPKAVVEKLAAKKIIASKTPSFYTPAYARLAPSLLTLEAEVDRTIAAVAAL
ncbi:MAG: aminotransferase class V-fold PLP-dependent enzyme [Kofleriaceae bacterium]